MHPIRTGESELATLCSIAFPKFRCFPKLVEVESTRKFKIKPKESRRSCVRMIEVRTIRTIRTEQTVRSLGTQFRKFQIESSCNSKNGVCSKLFKVRTHLHLSTDKIRRNRLKNSLAFGIIPMPIVSLHWLHRVASK